MSSDAIGWVFRFSPYRGTAFAVHLAIADSVNDQGGYEFWMRQSLCAAKARCGRQAVNESITRMRADGLLVLLRQGTGGANRYHFVMPRDLTPAFEIPPRPVGAGGVVTGDNPVAVNDRGVSPEATKGVACDDTEPNISQDQTQKEDSRRRRRIPDDFVVTEGMLAWARQNLPGVDVEWQTQQFVDHWLGKGETKLDWVAAWRTWMRNAEKFERGRSAPSKQDGRARVADRLRRRAQ